MQTYNRTPVDFTNCDKEPIHVISGIQPHGFLLVLNNTDLTIEQTSANVEHYLPVSYSQLVGNSLETLLPKEQYITVEKELKNKDRLNTLFLTLKSLPFFGFIHHSAQKIVLECEPYTRNNDTAQLNNTYLMARLQEKFNKTDTLEAASDTLSDFIQSFIDYDRVLVIRFDEDWHGEVIAESVKPGFHSFAGHHFPASDIPVPVRLLLEKKHVRHIPNVKAPPIEIVPYINPTTGLANYILESELRYPSPIHLEYLKNMHVNASLSFSVIVKGKLWGLIACSNGLPKFTDFWKRHLCEIVTGMYAALISSIQEKIDKQTFNNYKRTVEVLIERIHRGDTLSKALVGDHPNLLDITESTGVAIFTDNQLVLCGTTPAKAQLMDIIEWLAANNKGRVFYTKSLSKYIASAFAYRQQASGLLALEICRYNKEYLLFFKPQIKSTRVWAGNPNKAVTVSSVDQEIHPRKSFQRWVEEIQGVSLPWTLNELEIAQVLIKDIIAIRLRNQALKLELLTKELSEKGEEMKLKNNQLENFTKIMTHNLRAPIASIYGLCTFYQDEPTAENASFVNEHIQILSNNMLATIADLNEILQTKAGYQLKAEMVNIQEIIEKELQNSALIISQSGAEVITYLSETCLVIPKVYAESIVHNLISNALKYHADNRKPTIIIKSWVARSYFYLSVTDNGIGMDLSKIGNKLFGLYKTFHNRKEIDSKGMGLYMTKMQVESLGGQIAVESETDKGTTFTIKLKASGQSKDKR